MRNRGTNTNGSNFPKETVDAVWSKATVVPGYDNMVQRKDKFGALIRRDKHGDTAENGTGWEVDHIVPVSKGGTDLLSNLQPLQWQNNRAKADNPDGKWACAVPAK